VKKVGAPGKAKPPSAPETPRSKAQLLVVVWDHAVKKYNGYIADFREQIGPQPGGPAGLITHAIEWQGYNAMIGEAFLKGEALWAWTYIEPLRTVAALPDDLQTLAQIQEVLENQSERIMDELCGRAGHTSGGAGPWAPNSTNPLANIARDAACTAKRDALAMIRTMLQLLDSALP
jgi:hypothetical protein